MRSRMPIVLLLGGMTLSIPRIASAANCDQVRRYLSNGRSVEDVAETMIIDVDEVKKCQQAPAGDAKGGAKPEQKPADAPKDKAD